MPTGRVSLTIPRSRSAGLWLGLFLLIGCGGGEGEGRGGPTEPGSAIPNIRGIYSAPTFWTFEALRLADGTSFSWSCMGRVTIARQTGRDFLGSFEMMPPETPRCEDTSGNISGGVLQEDARISFLTTVSGQASDEFFGLPGCGVVTQEPLWTGSAAGNRLSVSRGATVDCPADGRLQVTVRAEGPRTTVFET